jgi:hypothetical protein
VPSENPEGWVSRYPPFPKNSSRVVMNLPHAKDAKIAMNND